MLAGCGDESTGETDGSSSAPTEAQDAAGASARGAVRMTPEEVAAVDRFYEQDPDGFVDPTGVGDCDVIDALPDASPVSRAYGPTCAWFGDNRERLDLIQTCDDRACYEDVGRHFRVVLTDVITEFEQLEARLSETFAAGGCLEAHRSRLQTVVDFASATERLLTSVLADDRDGMEREVATLSSLRADASRDGPDRSESPSDRVMRACR